jgi:hypothetical protein
MSRSKAKATIQLDDFQKVMKDRGVGLLPLMLIPLMRLLRLIRMLPTSSNGSSRNP